MTNDKSKITNEKYFFILHPSSFILHPFLLREIGRAGERAASIQDFSAMHCPPIFASPGKSPAFIARPALPFSLMREQNAEVISEYWFHYRTDVSR
jgi:hypothetical protein